MAHLQAKGFAGLLALIHSLAVCTYVLLVALPSDAEELGCGSQVLRTAAFSAS